MKRVLVTRPAPLAERTARRLAAMGYAPVLLPLTKTRPLEVDPARTAAGGSAPPLTPPRKGEGDGTVGWGSGAGLVAVTSANAILHAPGDLLRELCGLPCLAVGGATAAAARAAGFRSVSEGPGDAAGLAGLALSRGKAGTVVYLCGRVRRPDFERALRAAGVEPTVVETYDTVAVSLDDGQAAAALGAGVIDAALVYSAAAAEALDGLAGREAFAGLFRGTAFCCLSPRIAAALRAEAGRKILVPAEPTQDALLSLLAGPGGTSHHPSSFLAPVVW